MPYKPVTLEEILKKLPASSIARIEKRADQIRAEIDRSKRPAQKPAKVPAFKP